VDYNCISVETVHYLIVHPQPVFGKTCKYITGFNVTIIMIIIIIIIKCLSMVQSGPNC